MILKIIIQHPIVIVAIVPNHRHEIYNNVAGIQNYTKFTKISVAIIDHSVPSVFDNVQQK